MQRNKNAGRWMFIEIREKTILPISAHKVVEGLQAHPSDLQHFILQQARTFTGKIQAYPQGGEGLWFFGEQTALNDGEQPRITDFCSDVGQHLLDGALPFEAQGRTFRTFASIADQVAHAAVVAFTA